MKVLLDTNIVIHRETNIPLHRGIGHLFRWIDNLNYKKCIHQVTVDEINKLKNEEKLKGFSIKLQSYNVLPTTAPLNPLVQAISKKHDVTDKDVNDTKLLNEVYCGRVDFLITEDRKIHLKATELGIEDRVFTIDAFLEKVTSENPQLTDYKVLSVRKEYFGNIDLREKFFETFKEDYKGFEEWFNRKSDEIAYVCRSGHKVVAFLYLKFEDENEPYPDIQPTFPRKRRLKVGSFKVALNGYKLGERLLRIIFDNALRFAVEEIYLTIFPKRIEQERLVGLLEDFGFKYHGIKTSESGEEQVYVRDFSRSVSINEPKTTYPYMSNRATKYLVSIKPEYHTSLLPDSILRTESPENFVENEPFRNAISKVFISRSFERSLKPGDIVVLYRTGGYYESVVTTLGIVENVITSVEDEQHFVSLCRKRSVFSDDELIKWWNAQAQNRPFIINFLYAYSFPKRINLKRLIELGIVHDIESAPRGFKQISDDAFKTILLETKSDESLIVD
jgi:predicted nucleic acid-binding protein